MTRTIHSLMSHIKSFLVLFNDTSIVSISILAFVNRYLFSDWQFGAHLCVVIMIDTIFGVWVSLKNRQFGVVGFSKFITKVIIYWLFLCVVHSLTHFSVEGERNEIFRWFNLFAYSALIVKESASVMLHIEAIKPGQLPRWIITRFVDYNKTGNFADNPVASVPPTSTVD